jgi:hypothetical protein
MWRKLNGFPPDYYHGSETDPDKQDQSVKK